MNKMDLRHIGNEELLQDTQTLVTKERQLIAEILQYLAEIDRRRLYAQRGFSSLWEFATIELKYSSSAAYRRTEAMRLLKTLTPAAREETKAALNDGRLNLTAVNTMTQFLKEEKKENNKIYSAAKKENILKKLQGRSKPQCEEILAAVNPLNVEKAKKYADHTRALSDSRTEVCFAMGEELKSNLEQIKNLLAHQFMGTHTYEELLLKMSQIVLERIDPMKRAAAKAKSKIVNKESAKTAAALNAGRNDTITSGDEPTSNNRPRETANTGVKNSSAAEVKIFPAGRTEGNDRYRITGSSNRRPYIAMAIKQAVWVRDGGQCTYTNSDTGRRCTSKHRLQFDHVTPMYLGGKDTVENLSLKCSTHNSWLAVEKLGRSLMAKYVLGLEC